MGKKQINDFCLHIKPGQLSNLDIVILLGENGTGKTTFVKMLAGFSRTENKEAFITGLRVSYKPQKISPDYEGTVEELLLKKVENLHSDIDFKELVFKPLKIEKLRSKKIKHLSGGELQRVAVCICLGKKSDLYLID